MSAEIERLKQSNVQLLEFAKMVLRGVNSGSIKAKPIMAMDPEADVLETKSLATIAAAVIANAERSVA
jgi:hypothetical protein